jgi:hypothetical protein
MVILLPSYPRSGSTLARIILKNAFGIDSYSQYNDEIFREGPLQQTVGQKNFRGNFYHQLAQWHKIPTLIVCKTHDLPNHQTRQYSCVYIVRDVRDMLVSLMSFYNWEPTLENWYKIIQAPGKWSLWSQHAQQWLQTPHLRGVIHFEKLLVEPLLTMQNAFGKLLPPPRNTILPAFAELHQQKQRFFREGRAGIWQEHIPIEALPLLYELHGATLQQLGYEL